MKNDYHDSRKGDVPKCKGVLENQVVSVFVLVFGHQHFGGPEAHHHHQIADAHRKGYQSLDWHNGTNSLHHPSVFNISAKDIILVKSKEVIYFISILTISNLYAVFR